jgi:hypothetical protein
MLLRSKLQLIIIYSMIFLFLSHLTRQIEIDSTDLLYVYVYVVVLGIGL